MAVLKYGTSTVTSNVKQYRAIWLSDTHLGTRDCKADFLLDFLKKHESVYLYLAGDILDGWCLRKSWYWPQSHHDIVQKILQKARKGTKVVYVPGNHDEGLRSYLNMQFGGITVLAEAVHITADERHFLVIHGDQFDGLIQHPRWLVMLGNWAYETMLKINHIFNIVRCKFGYSYWSLLAFLKHKIQKAVNFISEFEHTLVSEARRRGFDGIICGHVHQAEIRQVEDILYCNTGDWVESCTALVEDWDGEFSIIRWTDN